MLSIACLTMAQSAVSQIREFVPIVRPVLGREMKESLEKLGNSLRSDGYDNVADYVKGYLAGGFGSGFVYVAPDGANYVVTNRHVVSQAETVTLEFEKADGSRTVIMDCRVVAFDDQVDIALVALPSGSRPFKAGLAFAQAMPEEGAEVWTAGYPGLGDTPSWQLGKGNISNAILKVPELIDPSVTTLIQHSAQVDPGNSGGPLLLADGKSVGGYRVIGINTWRVSNRQATNISIPMPAIRKFLSTTLDRKSGASKREDLEARCHEFAESSAAGEQPYVKMARFISDAYIAAEGEKAFRLVLATAPNKVLSSVMEAFAGYSPIEGMRYAIAYRISLSLKQDDGDQAAIPLKFDSLGGDPDSGTAPVLSKFTKAERAFDYSWIVENGKWRISGMPSLSSDAAGKKTQAGNPGTTPDFSASKAPYVAAILLRGVFVSGGMNGFFLDPALSVSMGPYFAFNAEAIMGGAYIAEYHSYLNVMLGASLGLVLRLPLTMGNFRIAPYGGLNASFYLVIGDFPAGAALSFDAGIEGAVGEIDAFKFSYNANYRGIGFLGGDDASTANAFCLGLGVAY
jgi:serine protease Do